MVDATVDCAHCGAVVPATFRFCGVCGRPLTCPHCGVPVTAGQRSCDDCASPLDPSPADAAPPIPDEAGLAVQRRVVSVLAADVEGSTRLATSLDAEDLHDVMEPLLDALADEVAAHGGTLQRYTGDGVMAVFGAPVARGDDPVRAVRAARAMQERLARLNASGRLPVPLGMRVGVATGDVVMVADDPKLARASGDAFNLAARLQTVAPVGEVAIGIRTRDDTRHAVVHRETAGPYHLKGFPEPLRVWLVGGDRVGDARYRLPLVGRTDELRVLREALRQAIGSRDGRAMTVVGEAGVGKSRLAHEFVTGELSASWPHARVVAGRCLPYGRGLSLWPLAEILRADLGARLDEPAQQLATRARRELLARWDAADGADLVPVLLASAGLPVTTGQRDLTSAHAASRDIVSRLVGRAWSSYLRLLADGDPLVVRVEDLQWGDADLVAVLTTIVEAATSPLLVLVTTRPGPRQLPVPGGDTLHLAPLDRDRMGDLLTHLLGETASPRLVSALAERAGGNPFFAEQLVEMLRDEGILDRAGGTGHAIGHAVGRLPDNVQAAIGARLDRLPAAELTVLLHAAVVGRLWWPAAVASLLGRPVDSEVDSLVDRGICHVLPDSEIGGQRQLSFAHVLLRDVAYERVARGTRPRLHGEVGRWIEARVAGREAEIAEILAHHFELADQHEATARYALLAGERKLSLYAADDALAWLERAQAAVDHGDLSDAAELAWGVAQRTGAARELLGEFATAEEHYLRARDIADRAGRDDDRAEALVAATHACYMQDAYDRAEALLADAIATARELGRDDLVSRATYSAGAVAHGRGRYRTAVAAQRDALATARAAGDREAEAEALHGLTDALAFAGPLDAALDHGMAGTALIRELGWLPMLHHNENMIGWILMWMGRLAEAEGTLVAAGEGATGLGDPRNTAHAYAGLGHIRWLCDDPQGAWHDLHRAAALERRFSGPRTRLLVTGHSLFALAAERRWEELRRCLAEAWQASDATGGDFLRAQLYAWDGWLALRAGNRADADARFASAKACAGDARTERWYVHHVEFLACAASGGTDRLIDIGHALLEIGTDGACARALGEYALVSAASWADVSEADTIIDRASAVATDLPPRYRGGWWRAVATVHERRGARDAAARARRRAGRPSALR